MRLRQAMGGRSAAEVARAVGLASTTMDGYLKGAVPAADRAFAIARELGVSAEWLITGEGARRPSESDSDWLVVPRYDLLAFEPDATQEPVEMMRIRREWVSRAVKSVRRLWVTTLTSDAMSDIGREGDLVLCEDVAPPLADGRVYVFLLDRTPIVRRLQMRPEGLVLKATDSAVDPITITAERSDALLPIGRVLATIVKAV
ncbi:MAG TPA: S24 family peptidase [Caulobacteraceae bacterium]